MAQFEKFGPQLRFQYEGICVSKNDYEYNEFAMVPPMCSDLI